MRVWSIPHPGVPIVTMTLLILRGSAGDPPGREGLASIAADLLDEGSCGRSAAEMHEAVSDIGAQLDIDVGADAIALTITVLSRVASRALALLADIALHPNLAEEDFSRVRQLRLHRMLQLRDVPGVVADRTFMKLLYGDDPYGHLAIGTEEALATLTADDARAFHAGALLRSEATLIVAGECDHEQLRREAADAFGGWHGNGGREAESALPRRASPRLVLVPRPGAPQSELRIGHVATSRSTPDYYALLVANMVLGGQFVSRINLNLRADKGFTYGARTAFDFRRRPGPFSLQASVERGATSRAVAESLGELAGIRGARPITDEEVAVGAGPLVRGYARGFETSDQLARAAAQLVVYDLPDDYFARFVPCVEAVTPGEATAAAARHIDPARLVTLVVGDLDIVAPGLAQLGLGEPLVLPTSTP